MHSRSVTRLAFAAALVATLSACGGAGTNAPAASGSAATAKVSIKLADDFTPADPLNTFLQKFADEVNQKAAGSISVTLFNGSQLGSETDIDRQLSNGAVQMSMVGVTGYAPLDAFFTPFAVKSEAQLGEILQQNLLKPYFDTFETKQNSHFIGSLYVTPREMTSNRPIKTLADLQGLVLRVPSNQAEVTVFKALGAQPTILAFTEVYTALQNGTAQAQENPVSTIKSAKFYEVQKYLNMTNHGIQPEYVFINAATWASMSPDQQAIVTSSFADIKAQQEAASKAAFDQDVADLQSHGMTVVQSDTAALRDKVYQSTVRPLLVGLWGEDVVAKIEKLQS
ncbi:MAG: TRAP transporter substrate-binding protein [Candidatus Limnocylindrales bacterium]